MNLHLHIAELNVIVHDDKIIAAILEKVKNIDQKLKSIVMTQQEAIDKLNGIASQLTKVKAEVQKLVDAAANDGNVSPELQAAIDAVASATQGVDDLNADETSTPPEGETPVGEQPA